MKKKDDKGRFTKTEEDLVFTGIRMKRSHLARLKEMCGTNETASDKIREAIAYYLANHQR